MGDIIFYKDCNYFTKDYIKDSFPLSSSCELFKKSNYFEIDIDIINMSIYERDINNTLSYKSISIFGKNKGLIGNDFVVEKLKIEFNKLIFKQ